MLEDFIEANNLSAQIISFSVDMDMQAALASRGLSPNSAAHVRLFLTSQGYPLVVVFPYTSKINMAKLHTLTKNGVLNEPDNRKTEEVTGYEKGFIPPVSVYGAQVILDKSLENKKALFIQIGHREFVLISAEEIAEHNEEFSVLDIAQKE